MMSDLVAVALISSGSSLLAATGGAIATYKVSLRGAQATIASAEAQKEVELAKVGAENKRLQQNNREEERRNRQSTYHQFIDAATAVQQIFEAAAPVEKRSDICDRYLHLLSGLLVFSPPAVREKAVALNEVYDRSWPALAKQGEEHPDKPAEERWKDATTGLRREFNKRASILIEAMHQDVTRGITSEDPAT